MTKNMQNYKDSLIGAVLLTLVILVGAAFALNGFFGWLPPVILLFWVMGLLVTALALWGLVAAWVDVYRKAGKRFDD